MWVRWPGNPAIEGATRERATTAAKNSVMLMLASAMSSNCMLTKQFGTGREAQHKGRLATEQMKPRWTKLAST